MYGDWIGQTSGYWWGRRFTLVVIVETDPQSSGGSGSKSTRTKAFTFGAQEEDLLAIIIAFVTTGALE